MVVKIYIDATIYKNGGMYYVTNYLPRMWERNIG